MNTLHVNPDACIACTSCTVVCPIAAKSPDFLGPKMIGPAYERFRLAGIVEDKSLSYCSNCKNCEIACPQGVAIASINMLARARMLEGKHPHFVRDWIVSHSDQLAATFTCVPSSVKNWALQNSLVRRVLDCIGLAGTFPRYAKESFRRLFPKLPQAKGTKKIALFLGCYLDLYDEQTARDLVFVLNRAGYEVVSSDEFVCCGVPLIAGGFLEDARKKAERNLAVMHRFAEQGIAVLTACPSCELMFKEEIPVLFPELGSSPIVDAQEFLLEAGFETKSLHEKILYHAPCHMRALGIGLPGYELLSQCSPHLEQAAAGCCGIAGSYGFKKEKYALSLQVGEALFQRVKDARPDCVATECGTCRLQIAQATGMPCVHPVSLFRKALD